MNGAIAIDNKLSELINRSSTLATEDFFNKFPGEPSATIYSRIRQLIKRGKIQRVGRGQYAIGDTKEFKSSLDSTLTRLFQSVNDEFPYSELVIWKLSYINEMLHHLVNMDIIFIDIDRESVEPLYWYLKSKGYNVVTRKRMVDELSEYDGYIMVRPLVTSAPKIKDEGIVSPKIEKILVDLACDKEFESFQGSEIIHIYENAFNDYTINVDSLLRYADRKGKREHVANIINTIKRQ